MVSVFCFNFSFTIFNIFHIPVGHSHVFFRWRISTQFCAYESSQTYYSKAQWSLKICTERFCAVCLFLSLFQPAAAKFLRLAKLQRKEKYSGMCTKLKIQNFVLYYPSGFGCGLPQKGQPLSKGFTSTAETCLITTFFGFPRKFFFKNSALFLCLPLGISYLRTFRNCSWGSDIQNRTLCIVCDSHRCPPSQHLCTTIVPHCSLSCPTHTYKGGRE